MFCWGSSWKRHFFLGDQNAYLLNLIQKNVSSWEGVRSSSKKTSTRSTFHVFFPSKLPQVFPLEIPEPRPISLEPAASRDRTLMQPGGVFVEGNRNKDFVEMTAARGFVGWPRFNLWTSSFDIWVEGQPTTTEWNGFRWLWPKRMVSSIQSPTWQYRSLMYQIHVSLF